MQVLARMVRHTAATILFRPGWNAVQVQKFLGHHSPAFTLATYVHLLPDDLPEPHPFDGLATHWGGGEGRRSTASAGAAASVR